MPLDTQKNRLMAILTASLLVGFLLTILISFFVSRHSLRSQIVSNTLPLTSDNIYSEIQRDLLQPIFISSLMASDTFVRDWVLTGEQDRQEIIRYLGEIKKKYGMFTAFLVSDKTQLYYHPDDGVLKKVSLNEERDAWYFRVREMAEPYEINVDYDMANDDAMTVFVNFRMLDYADEYIGVTGVGLAVHAVARLIESYEKRYERQIYFIDKEGAVKLAGKTFPSSVTNVFTIEDLNKEKDNLLSSKGHSMTYRKGGSQVHLASRYIPEFDWYLIVEESEKNAVRQVVNTLFVNLVICGIVIMIVLYITHVTISSYQKRLETLAITDKLTNVYNRRAFDLLLDQTLKEKKRSGNGFSIMLLDLDLFKDVNDTYGHLAGDRTIQEVVSMIQNSVRESDIICRWGGEEFLVILKSCDLENAGVMAENLRKKVENCTVVYDDKKIKVTVSLGVAEYTAGENEDNLLSRADKALYRAKSKGRNRVELEG